MQIVAFYVLIKKCICWQNSLVITSNILISHLFCFDTCFVTCTSSSRPTGYRPADCLPVCHTASLISTPQLTLQSVHVQHAADQIN